jgi:4-hydroxy-3-polyprenylbenzoate decarboxylase
VRLIVGITGATGAVYGVRLLEHLRRLGGVHTHLVVSAAGWLSVKAELDLSPAARSAPTAWWWRRAR